MPIPEKKIKIYLEGCWDLVHSGHFNAIRQAKELGDILYVGVISDEEITKNKGPPVLNHSERLMMIQSCKWVDIAVENVEYDPTVAFLDKIGCDYNAHGDDIAKNSLGEDSNFELKKAGRFNMFRRTEGISTTDIVGRLLSLAPNETSSISTIANKSDVGHLLHEYLKERKSFDEKDLTVEERQKSVQFLATTRRLIQFSNRREPLPEDKIVYVDGTFDVFTSSHCELFQKAKQFGTFLVVGVFSDEKIKKNFGRQFPVLTIQERILNILACKYVDEILIGAPYYITEDLLKTIKISTVCESSVCLQEPLIPDPDRYSLAKQRGIHKILELKDPITLDEIILRIIKNREIMKAKHDKGKKKENEYYKNKS